MSTEFTFYTEAFDWSDPEGSYRAGRTAQGGTANEDGGAPRATDAGR